MLVVKEASKCHNRGECDDHAWHKAGKQEMHPGIMPSKNKLKF